MPTTFSGGTLTNGVFTAPVAGGGTVTLSPLTAGSSSQVTGVITPIGAVSGTAFLSTDSSFFYADLTTGTQTALIEGGIPITSATTTIGAANQVLAFNVQSDPALGSNIPFIRNATGGNLSGATVSPLYLVTPNGTPNNARTLQASLAINGAGNSQQSVIVTNIGAVTGTPPGLVGALRGTSLLSSTGTPVVISSATNSTADGVGGGLYGTTGLSGIALAATSPFATETPLTGTPTTYNFNQPAVATSLPLGVGPGLNTSTGASFIPANTNSLTPSGYFGGLLSSTATTGPYAVTGTTLFTQTGPTTFSATFTSDNQFPFLSLPQNNTGNLYNLTLTFGGTPSTTPNSTIIDGNIYGATEAAAGASLSDSVGGAQSTRGRRICTS